MRLRRNAALLVGHFTERRRDHKKGTTCYSPNAATRPFPNLAEATTASRETDVVTSGTAPPVSTMATAGAVLGMTAGTPCHKWSERRGRVSQVK
jgi:hypothetical protein